MDQGTDRAARRTPGPRRADAQPPVGASSGRGTPGAGATARRGPESERSAERGAGRSGATSASSTDAGTDVRSLDEADRADAAASRDATKAARDAKRAKAAKQGAFGRRSGGGGAGGHDPGAGHRPNRLTRRAAILALALCADMITIAYPLQQYLAQRSQTASENRQNAALSAQVANLQRQLDDWNDPAYVATQARARLHYLLPGEYGYLVPNPSAGSEPIGIPSATAQPWYDKLWQSVKSPSASPSPSAPHAPDTNTPLSPKGPSSASPNSAKSPAAGP